LSLQTATGFIDNGSRFNQLKRESSDCQTGIFECPKKPEHGFVMYKDPNDCRYYYECHKDGAYRYDCGPGKHFVMKKCEDGACPKAKQGCKELKQGRPERTGSFVCPSDAKEGDTFADHNDCQYYFTCSEDQKASRSDCGTGKHYEFFRCQDGECPYKLPGSKPQD